MDKHSFKRGDMVLIKTDTKTMYAIIMNVHGNTSVEIIGFGFNTYSTIVDMNLIVARFKNKRK